MSAVSPDDFRRPAKRRLPRFLFDYIDGGSGSEISLRRNETDLAAAVLRQRVLRAIGTPDCSQKPLGKTCKMPVAPGPIGLAGMNARRGECKPRAQRRLVESHFASALCRSAHWMRMWQAPPHRSGFSFMMRDRGFMEDLPDAAAGSGASARIFTVDMPVPGIRYRDLRSGLAGRPGLRANLKRFGQAAARPRWAWDVGVRGRPHALSNFAPLLKGRTGLDDFISWMRLNFDPTVSWSDLEFIRSRWRGPLVIKGILDPEDARAAVTLGADGIVVSNYSGRQLDGAMSTARALPAILDAVDGRLEVLDDGGVRSGFDVVRMLSLGARGVLLGRAWAFALAAAGEEGICRLLEMIEAEMRIAMTLVGARSVKDLGPDKSLGGFHP